MHSMRAPSARLDQPGTFRSDGAALSALSPAQAAMRGAAIRGQLEARQAAQLAAPPAPAAEGASAEAAYADAGGWIPSTIKEGLEYYAQGDLESEELDEIVSALDKLRIRSVNQLAGLTLPKAEAALNKSDMRLGESELVLKLIAGLRGEDPGTAPTEPVAPRPLKRSSTEDVGPVPRMPTDLDELDKMDPQQLAKIIQKLPARNVLDPAEAVSTFFSVIADHLPPREKLQKLQQAVDAHRDGAPFFPAVWKPAQFAPKWEPFKRYAPKKKDNDKESSSADEPFFGNSAAFLAAHFSW